MKLEVGPGPKKLGAEWITLNLTPPADILWNLRRIPYPIDDGSVSLLYASHVLEHLPWFETVDVLREWRRLLKPGGILEVHVPDFAKIVEAYHDRSLPAVQNPWWRRNPAKDPFLWIAGRIFAYPGNQSFPPVGPGEEDPNWHRAIFDEAHLRRCLELAGFGNLTRLDRPRGHDHGWINLGMKGTR